MTETDSSDDSQIRVQVLKGQTSWAAVLAKDRAATRSNGQQRDCEEMGASELRQAQ